MNNNNVHKLVLNIDTENEDVWHPRKHGLISKSITYDAVCSMRGRKRSPEVW
jgi:hypothetical protein